MTEQADRFQESLQDRATGASRGAGDIPDPAAPAASPGGPSSDKSSDHTGPGGASGSGDAVDERSASVESTSGHRDDPVENGDQARLDPTRYGDWEKNGRCIDF